MGCPDHVELTSLSERITIRQVNAFLQVMPFVTPLVTPLVTPNFLLTDSSGIIAQNRVLEWDL